MANNNGDLKKEEPIMDNVARGIPSEEKSKDDVAKENKIEYPVTIVEIKQEETGEVKLYTKLIPPLLIYNMVLMLFSVVNNVLKPKQNIIQVPKGVFHGRLSNFLKGK